MAQNSAADGLQASLPALVPAGGTKDASVRSEPLPNVGVRSEASPTVSSTSCSNGGSVAAAVEGAAAAAGILTATVSITSNVAKVVDAPSQPPFTSFAGTSLQRDVAQSSVSTSSSHPPSVESESESAVPKTSIAALVEPTSTSMGNASSMSTASAMSTALVMSTASAMFKTEPTDLTLHQKSNLQVLQDPAVQQWLNPEEDDDPPEWKKK